MRLMLTLPLLLACVACGRTPSPDAAMATPVAAASSPALPLAAGEYVTALATIEQAKSPVSLEALLEKAETVQGVLMEVSGDQAVLERYSDAEFATLQAQMRGLKLHRGMDVYVQPDPAFFLALAKTHGTPADVAFFSQHAATWGPDDVPVYLKLRPQPSPCVRFGEGRIAPLYAGWQAFAMQHPSAYTQRAQQNLLDLEEAVALGTCACDGLESVRSEQADFLKQFPATPKAAAIKARREQLANDPDAMPVHCR